MLVGWIIGVGLGVNCYNDSNVRKRGQGDAGGVDEEANCVRSARRSHISNNAKRQLDIFNSLSLPDLQKIVLNLHDSNESNSC